MSDVSDILQEELDNFLKEIIRQHEAAGQVASKKTRDSFKVEVSENYGKLVGASYAGVLEKGRKSGKVPARFYKYPFALDVSQRYCTIRMPNRQR